MKTFHVLMTAWHVGKLIGWLILTTASVAAAGDDRRPTVPLRPIPHNDPLPPPADSTGRADTETRQGTEEQDAQAPVSLRDFPMIQLMGDPVTCLPCRQAVRDLTAAGVRFQVFRQPPDWVAKYGTPCFAWQVELSDTGWRYWLKGYPGLDALLAEVQRTCREYDATFSLAALAPGKSVIEQIKPFLPDGTVITVSPPRPVSVKLDDGSVVSFSRVTGRVSTVNGQPQITFDAPLPSVRAKKWFLSVNADVKSAGWEPPATVLFGTSLGVNYRLRIEEVRK